MVLAFCGLPEWICEICNNSERMSCKNRRIIVQNARNKRKKRAINKNESIKIMIFL